jgi:uracil-DNA glycosylase
LREWLGVSPAVFYDPNQIALLPMGFCYPGRGNNGDLPPRPECEPAWRTELLDQLPHLKMTLVLGQYAQRYHFGATGSTLTDRVKSWQTWWPDKVPLPHPSPRNNAWLSKNPWFERNLLPALKPQIATVLTG